MTKWWILAFTGILLAGIYQPALTGQGAVVAPVASPTAVPTPTTPPPVRLAIPALGLEAPVEAVAMDSEGRMATAQGEHDVAWYELGAKPGEAGKAVIDGHLDTPYGPSVFWNLSSLKPGDEIHVTGTDGSVRTFIVDRKQAFPDASFPMTEVFGPDPGKKLNLITCTGTWDRVAKNYSHRLVVFSTLKEGQ